MRIHDTGRVSLVRVDHLSPGVVPESKLVQLLSWRTHREIMVPGVPAGTGQRRPRGHTQVSARPGAGSRTLRAPFSSRSSAPDDLLKRGRGSSIRCQCPAVPRNRPADSRGRPALESPILSAAVRVCGLPPGPSTGVLGGVSPLGPLRQPRSVPAGRGRHDARSAITAGGRIPLRRGSVPRSALLTNGGRHSRAPDF
ncbi:hypothetical protein NDU88_002378 [Pleurodeles waltl]|uniref:Uncharacterized protein n=1 Tax=Pleurodeles waltl TaxID=8319 RepID=A0AAV7M201_PLEWA|nr:hypothetical protein NDU88_002378 [Pleurodeles waltl]